MFAVIDEGKKRMKRRPFLFICMPITPRDDIKNHAIEFLDNIRRGAEIAVDFINWGASVYCPGNDIFYWLVGSGPTAEAIYAQDLGIIQRVDALVTLPGWEKSKNCTREYQSVVEMNKPIFHYPDEAQELLCFIHFFEEERANE